MGKHWKFEKKNFKYILNGTILNLNSISNFAKINHPNIQVHRLRKNDISLRPQTLNVLKSIYIIERSTKNKLKCRDLET